MASEVDIWNRALQRLGVSRVSSTSEESRNADACRAVYAIRRDALLEKHTWRFAIERFSLAADAVAPAWGKANSFQLPTGFIRLVNNYPEMNAAVDREIEGTKLLTNESAPLNIRCVVTIEDVNQMSPLFRELLALDMAHEMCEELTQSNTKKAGIQKDIEKAEADAKKANGFNRPPGQLPEDPWITGRS